MKNLSIGKRLWVTFGIILGLFVITVLLSLAALFSTGANFDEFYNQAYEVNNEAANLKLTIQTVGKNIGYAMMEEDESKTAEYVADAEAEIQKLRDGTVYMKENFQGDQSIVEAYDQVMISIKDDRDRVLQLARENKNQEAIQLYFTKVMPGLIEASGYLEEIGASASEDADHNYNSASRQKNIIAGILIALSLVTLAATVVMADFITKSITRPVAEIENAAKEMAQGSLNVSLSYQGGDELGSLAESMRTLTVGVHEIVEDIGRILAGLADGNFHVSSSCLNRYIADYKPILLSMRLIRDRLNETMQQISEAARQVAAGAGQMSQNAQGLAEGATEQAGAVEELTATIEDVANTAEKSAESTKEVYEQIRVSAEKAESGKQEMQELIQAMERISETSREIENIITAIEDIASQTNLLSLNASIEAARAGEAGRGFAVVADQIGKLASDSAQSAVNTKELISKTLDEISAGNDITKKTSQAFEEVIEEMKSFADIARESSDSSMTQFGSLQQVRAGIEQISIVVQSNSAAAEETSATSEELLAQAESLDGQVSKFKLLA